ncbi:MAG: hypothetical protein F4Z72_03840 [Gemmatimonadales bacterium]|uniref:hypothetical protein n=1 Tax=Candidatus Palauibacter irciniicola TaxID=3056733 RepID=UPI001380574B|nr:hypothetical protein [Candidatus Palauibacter irciniicola]MYC19776.1 hypothetical protein [Gemmatimonadales bacterium]
MRRLLRIAAHVAVIALLYLMFSFSLFLGLQVNTTYGNIGMVVSIGAVIAYVLVVRRRRSLRMAMEDEDR